jgi:hypothetical protein
LNSRLKKKKEIKIIVKKQCNVLNALVKWENMRNYSWKSNKSKY